MCCGTAVSTFSESRLVVFSISVPEDVAIPCKLNGYTNNYNVLYLSGKDTTFFATCVAC